MSALLALGARLALAGGRGRASLVAAGNAAGTCLLLLVFAIPHALTPPEVELLPDERRLLAVIVVALAVPVILLTTVAGSQPRPETGGSPPCGCSGSALARRGSSRRSRTRSSPWPELSWASSGSACSPLPSSPSSRTGRSGSSRRWHYPPGRAS